MTERLTGSKLAERWGISPQAVALRAKEAGFPMDTRGKRRTYPWPKVNDWWIERCAAKAGRDAAPGDIDEARLRKVSAEAEILEMQRDTERGKLIEVALYERGLMLAFGRVRERLVALAPRVAPHLLRLESEAEAEALVDRYVMEAIAELRADEVPEDEPVEVEVAA